MAILTGFKVILSTKMKKARNRLSALILLIFIQAFLTYSCGGKQEQVSMLNPMDEAIRFAKTVYGEKAELTLKGDLNADGKPDAFAVVVKRKISDMTLWIEKGGVVEKEPDGWKVIFSLGDKLYSSKGVLIDQMEAKYGYLVTFDMTENPVSFRIFIADAQGNPASNQYVVKWNKQNELYEVVSGTDSPEKKIP